VPQSVLLAIDGREAARIQTPGRNKYTDQNVSVPAGTRPRVSELILSFDPSESGQLDFKLDRLLVQTR
jgi:hypothetical protein